MSKLKIFLNIFISLIFSVILVSAFISCDFSSYSEKDGEEQIIDDDGDDSDGDGDVIIVDIWRLVETCQGSVCESSPFTISFDLDATPGDDTSITNLIYLHFADDNTLRIYKEITAMDDPYNIFNGHSVGDITYCPSEDETYSIDGNAFTITNIGSGTITLSDDVLVLEYSNGDKDTLNLESDFNIAEAYEYCF